MTTRITQRRNTEVVSVMKFLQNKDMSACFELPISTQNRIVKDPVDLIVNLFGVGPDNIQNNESNDDLNIELVSDNIVNDAFHSLTVRLNEAIEVSVALLSSENTSVDMRKTTKQALAIFEASNELNDQLRKLLTALKPMQPTSMES